MRSNHARSSRVRLLATCCSLGAAVASGAARADSVSLSAGAAYTVDPAWGGVQQTVSASRPPDSTDPNIFPSATGVKGSTVFGHDYSSQPTGLYQFGTRSSGESSYSISGSANYTDTFAAGAGGAYAFHFDIDAGELSVSSPDGADGTQSASVGVLITVTIGSGSPTTLFDYTASMSVLSSIFYPTFSETGATLNPTGYTDSPGAGDYVWDVYHGTVSLGALTRGEVVTVSETLTSSASGLSDPQSCGTSGTGGNGGGGDFALLSIGDGGNPLCGSALARIGDPPFITTPLAAPSILPVGATNAVPEPSTWTLLAFGFAGLGYAGHRARARASIA
jgi:PEP-CTERM motif